ncbi:MAG TPA: hypothetical protein VF209_02415 [Patescibacteria group bacterium]
MIHLLYLIPLFSLGSIIILYQLNGKRDFLWFDLVQFFYGFIVAPLVFVWAKSFLFHLMSQEVNVGLSTTELFIIDTIFSTFCLYVYAFVVIHALTKSFSLKTLKDPLFDIFYHSEVLHLWWTHLITFGGGMAVMTTLAITNLFFASNIYLDKASFYTFVTSGILVGSFALLGVWLSDPKQEGANFMRIMKLFFGFFFIIHVVGYFLLNPAFNSQHLVYWWSLFVFATLVTISLFTYRSRRARSTMERLVDRFKHSGWGFNIELFEEK